MSNMMVTGAGSLTMSSQEIAELVGSRHDSVKRTIERLAEKQIISQPPLVDGPRSANGVVVQGYQVCKRDSYVIVAQLCPEFTARLVDRWQELEEQLAAPRELSRIELLQMALESEQDKLRISAERDHAVATKAQIGSKREATAMAKASAATREVQRLKEELGRNAAHATVTAVERATGTKLPRNAYVLLRKWCKTNNVPPADVVDPRYGTVKAWPAGAWLDIQGIDLSQLFPA